MGPTWGRQDPGGPHIGAMNFDIWASEWGLTSAPPYLEIVRQDERNLYATNIQLTLQIQVIATFVCNIFYRLYIIVLIAIVAELGISRPKQLLKHRSNLQPPIKMRPTQLSSLNHSILSHELWTSLVVVSLYTLPWSGQTLSQISHGLEHWVTDPVKQCDNFVLCSKVRL